MRKKSFCICIIALGALLFLCSCNASQPHIHMFSEIEECLNIDSLKENEAEVTIYASPVGDEGLKKLDYKAFWGCSYLSNDLSFELFAYEFYDTETALNYFENTTGKVGTVPISYSSNTGMVSYRRIVTNENMAYTVRCKPKDKEKVLEFINGWFTLDVTDDIMKSAEST